MKLTSVSYYNYTELMKNTFVTLIIVIVAFYILINLINFLGH